MRKAWLLAIIMLALPAGMAACSQPAPEPTCSPAGYSYTDYSAEQGVFKLGKTVWGDLSVHFTGEAELTEGTRLKAQLYKDGEAAAWWPDEYASYRVRDGKWEICVKADAYRLSSVKASGRLAPEGIPALEPGYTLQVWNAKRPEETATFSVNCSTPLTDTTVFDSGDDAAAYELEGSRWRLVSINGSEPVTWSGPTGDFEITLKFSRGVAGGFSGCNHYGGRYVTKESNLISFCDMASTELYCDKAVNQQAETYLHCLMNAICYRVIDDRLEMYDAVTRSRSLVFESWPTGY